MDHEEKEFQELKTKVDDCRKRITRLCELLSGFYVGKREILEVMAVATAAQEPLLLIGEPGTAKSDLIVKFCQGMGLDEGEYFEYMLTKFTEPSEIVGPIDLNQLKKGKYVRKIDGKLPTARVVFLDEIFKSNSAILNTLLTIINERKFYQDGKPVPVEMRMLFAATNDIPEFDELGALKDRFALKISCPPVHMEHFDELIWKGVANEMMRSFDQAPWKKTCSLEDFLEVRRYLDYLIFGAEEGLSGVEAVQKDISRYWPRQVYHLFRRILQALIKDHKVFITDRKIIKLYRLIRTRAFLLHGGEVREDDLVLLRHVGDKASQIHLIRDQVDQMLSLG